MGVEQWLNEDYQWKIKKIRRENHFSPYFSITNLTLIHVGLNSGLCNEKQASNRLNNGTTYC
jgi:hypothetical protein